MPETGRLRNLNDASTLTEWEWFALRRSANLADGHAHGMLSDDQVDALGDLTELFLAAENESQESHERKFLNAYFSLAGQTSRRVFLHYSASTSIEIAGKVLKQIGARKVGLLEPTFDNVPLLLKRAGLQLENLSEDLWEEDERGLAAVLKSLNAIFLVAPNNPTGREPTEQEFRRMSRAASATGTVLVCDFSFRFFSDLQTWDQYAIAEGEGCLDYLLLEDTGKTWPARELKVGMLSASERLVPHASVITNEVMLNVSPFTLGVLARFIGVDQKRRDLGEELHSVRTVSRNRTVLREHLDALPLHLEAPASQISVEWVGVPETWETTALCRWLDAHGVTTLPGNPFYWRNPEMGRSRMRIALMRETGEFRSDVIRLIELLEKYGESHPIA